MPDEIAAMGRARLAMRRGTAESFLVPRPSSPVWLFPHAKARPDWIGGWFSAGIGMDRADAPAGSQNAPIDATASAAQVFQDPGWPSPRHFRHRHTRHLISPEYPQLSEL